MNRFLVVHEYGAGSVWRYICANDPSEIHAAFRGLQIIEEPPKWWSDDLESRTPVHRLGEPICNPILTLLRR